MTYIRILVIALSFLSITGCAPNKSFAQHSSHFYHEEGEDSAILVAGYLDNAAKAYFGGIAHVHPLAIKFGNSVVATGNLNSHYQGSFNGVYNNKPVIVTCGTQKSGHQWKKVVCTVTHGDTTAATLTF